MAGDDGLITLNLTTELAKKQVKDSLFTAVKEIAEQEILPDAKARSPKSEELRPDETIHNADSLAVKVSRVKAGVKMRLFSQSGHGGYLEIGTSKIAAEPYMMPAFQAHISSVYGKVKEKIKSIPRKRAK